jgi:hypothetical protein
LKLVDLKTVQLEFKTQTNKMKIKVKTITGNLHIFEAKENDKISALKLVIEEKVAIHPDQQRLVHSGKILPDDKTITELKINETMTLQLIVQITGGTQ